LFSTQVLAADELQGFFPKDGALTTFSDAIELTPQKEIVLLRPKVEKAKKEDSKEATQSKEGNFAREALDKKEGDRHIEQPKTQAEILATYGDPTKPYPVAAVDQAPAPFKGLVAALNLGDEELAFKYAIQYARYQEQHHIQNQKIVGFLGQAKRKEGMLPEGSWPDSDKYKDYAYLRDMELEGFDDSGQSNSDSYNQTIDLKAKQIIARLKAAKNDLFDDRKKEIKQELNQWEQSERNKARSELAGRVPIDPKGEVAIYYFFRPYDEVAIEMAKEIDKLNKLVKQYKHVRLVGMGVGANGANVLQSFVTENKFSFPVVDGNVLSKTLALKSLPATVFVTSNGKSHVQEGLNNVFYLDELRKIMQGK